jgi:polyisoprenoid-binding protein YceI
MGMSGMPVAQGGNVVNHGPHLMRVVMARYFARNSPVFAVALFVAICTAISVAGSQGTQVSPLTIDIARVSIAGTSNVHPYTASTTAVRMTRVQLASSVAGPDLWDAIVKPGAIEALDITIAAAQLSSPREGVDKNMHKALKVQEHPEITFSLRRLEAGVSGGLKATALLQIAGVEREVAMDIQTERKTGQLVVTGSIQLLMTDYGIAPPKAMLGMLKTDPRVTVTFETVLGIPLT